MQGKVLEMAIASPPVLGMAKMCVFLDPSG